MSASILPAHAGMNLLHSPNLRGAMPRPVLTSAMVAARAAARVPVVPVVRPSARDLAREAAARSIADRRRAFWQSEHPGEDWSDDEQEYLALGRELCEAGLGQGLASQWLSRCCDHYRAALDGGAFRYLETHQTQMQAAAPGLDPRLVCVRCGAVFPALNREACRGEEIYRERVREDKARLGSLVELFSELGG